MVEGSTYRTVTAIKQQPFKCQGGCVWFNSNQNAATLGDEEQRRGMETSTYYLLPGEREERDNSGLCLICCGNLREVMFSLIKKEKKRRKKKNVCFQRCPCHQPGSPSSAVQMRYTTFTAGQSWAELHPGGMKSCGVWLLASPWLPWRQKTEYEGGTGGSAGYSFEATAVKCFYLQIKLVEGCEMLLFCTQLPWAALEGMGGCPCPQKGVGIVPPSPCQAGGKQGWEVSEPLWLSC